jgi:hypothetical protein
MYSVVACICRTLSSYLYVMSLKNIVFLQENTSLQLQLRACIHSLNKTPLLSGAGSIICL